MTDLPIEDRWILSRLATTAKAVTEQLEGYRFNEVSRTIYDFTWSEFCDWYIEMAKGRLKKPAGKSGVQRILVGVLDAILKLVHPVMPFVAESIWQALNEIVPERGLPTPAKARQTIAFAPWPTLPDEWIDLSIEQTVAHEQQLTQAVREVRNRYNIPSSTLIPFVAVTCSEPIGTAIMMQGTQMVQQLGGVAVLKAGPEVGKLAQSSTAVTSAGTAYISVAGFRDDAAEIKRLEKQVADKVKQLEGTKKKLSNADFVAKAPPEVVTSQRELIADLEKQIASMEETIRELKT